MKAPVGRPITTTHCWAPIIVTACWWPWGQRKVDGFRLVPRGAATGPGVPTSDRRGVGAAGRVGQWVAAGEVCVALSYMAGNEWSPKYPSELVMITRTDDRPPYPFEAYYAVTAPVERLSDESQRFVLAAGRGAAGVVAAQRQGVGRSGLAIEGGGSRRSGPSAKLIWLAAATGRTNAGNVILALASDADPVVRLQSVRRAERVSPTVGTGKRVHEGVRGCRSAARGTTAIVALFDRREPLDVERLAAALGSDDTYLRQASGFLLAARATDDDLDMLLASPRARRRLAGVLGVGFHPDGAATASRRLPPPELPLRYEFTRMPSS